MKDLLSRPPRPSPQHRWVTTLAVFDRDGNLEREEGYWYLGPWAYAHANPAVHQTAFVGVNDDGSLTTATEIAADNTNWTQDSDTTFRVRFQIQEVNGGSANNDNFVLYYSLNGGGYAVVTASTPVQFAANGNSIADGAAISTERLGTTISVNGEFDQDGSVANRTLTSDTTEMEYCLTIDSAQVSNTNTIALRVYNGASALDNYTNTPTITAAVPVIVTLAGTIPAVSGAQTAQMDRQPGGAGTISAVSYLPAAELNFDSTYHDARPLTSRLNPWYVRQLATGIPTEGAATVELAGTIPAVSGASGAVDDQPPLAGTVPGVSGASGSVDDQPPLAGTVAASSGAIAELDLQPGAAGTIPAVSGAQASELDLQPSAAGTISAVSGAQASELDLQPGAAGTIPAVSGGSGSVDDQPPLAGTVPAVSGGSGSVDDQPPLAGTLAASSGATADLTVGSTYSGTLAASSGAQTAELDLQPGAAGTIPAVSGGSGSVDDQPPLVGTVAASSGAQTADLTTGSALSGTVASSSGATTAELDLQPGASGTIAATSGASGEVSGQLSLGGTVAAVSGAAAILDQGIPGLSTFYRARPLSAGLNPYIRQLNPTVISTVMELGGQLDAASGGTGELDTQPDLDGTLAASSAVSDASLGSTMAIAGSIASASSMSADAALHMALQNALIGVDSSFSGELTIFGDPNDLVGTVASDSGGYGLLDSGMGMGSSLDAVSGAVAALSSSVGMSAVMPAASGADGELNVVVPLDGTVAAVSWADASLVSAMGMDARVVANSGAAAALWATLGAEGQIEVVSALLRPVLEGVAPPQYSSLRADRLQVVAPLEGVPEVVVAIQTEHLTILARNSTE